jgi:hypothetical protein
VKWDVHFDIENSVTLEIKKIDQCTGGLLYLADEAIELLRQLRSLPVMSLPQRGEITKILGEIE